MRIAYLLLVHEFPQNVKYLIEQILIDQESIVYVHVDRSVAISDYFYLNDRVHYLKKRNRVTWGGYSVVKATLSLIKEAQKSRPDYYCLLSGRDFLIRSPLEWNNQLMKIFPKTYLDGGTIVKRWTERGLDRVQYHFFYWFKNRTIALYQNRLVRKIGKKLHITRKMPLNMVPYCGSQWWTISNRHMRYIINFLAKHPEFIRFYKTVGIPDEQFFHTILLNSELKDEIINQSQTYLIMNRGIVRLFNMDDYNELINQRFFFARKIKEDHLELQKNIVASWDTDYERKDKQ